MQRNPACLHTTHLGLQSVALHRQDQRKSAVSLKFSDIVTSCLQVYLLECLAKQTFEKGEATEVLLTRVSSRLQHANSAVVLAAVKVVLAHLDGVTNAEKHEELLRKLAAPLVTLLSQRAEVQYVALRNINLILQKYPEVLATEARVLFCKYNDPIYVKLEKLELMVALASEQNTTAVLAELKEYAQVRPTPAC